MILSAKTKVFELTEAYPFLIDFLADYNQKFAGLKNPVLRKTFGRAATIGRACAIGGSDPAELLRAIKTKIEETTGEKIELDLLSAPASLEERQHTLKKIIEDLHAGAPMEELKKRFAELIEDIGPTEIAEMEQALIAAGMPDTEIKKLCDVHVEVFRDALKDQDTPKLPPGHPVNTFMAENQIFLDIAGLLRESCIHLGESPSESELINNAASISEILDKLSKVDLHYLRKENQLFPRLEEHGVTGPPKVMWAVHDDIRATIKKAQAHLKAGEADEFVKAALSAATQVTEMVFKEEHILFPMSLDVLGEQDWIKVRQGEEELGFAFVTPGNEWNPQFEDSTADDGKGLGRVYLEVGALTQDQVNLLFTHLPLEVSFTDENHVVRYYSQGKERIFPRSPGVIGRHVENCHPPKSLHMVREILRKFENGERDVAEFWIDFQDKFVHIRYFALRDEEGNFKGTMEVVQDVSGIRNLTGERRLLEWK